MMARVFTRLLCGVAFLAFAWLPAQPAKDPNDPIVQKIEQERRTLEQLKNEIEEKKKRAD